MKYRFSKKAYGNTRKVLAFELGKHPYLNPIQFSE